MNFLILKKGQEYVIDRGSREGIKRLGFDFVTIHITFPGVRPLIPEMPDWFVDAEGRKVPPPTTMEYVEGYLPYLMESDKKPGEDYTYGERLAGWSYIIEVVKETTFGQKAKETENQMVNQITEVIRMYKEEGHGTNQATMAVAIPSDILLKDPPCLRQIDTRIRNRQLHFIINFRSWDLWNGFSANLAALQLLKEYMASEIGVEDGEMIANIKFLGNCRAQSNHNRPHFLRGQRFIQPSFFHIQNLTPQR